MTCYLLKDAEAIWFACGDLGPQCRCGDFADYLCDFPVFDGVTCDADLCLSCAHEIAPELHYCKAHHQMWREFVDKNGVKEHLENVVPFKSEVSNG